MDSQSDFDFDDLPEEQPRESPRGTIILWLVALSWLILLIPLYLVSTTVRAEITRLEAEFQVVQDALISEETPEPEIQALQDDLSQVQGRVDEIEAAYVDIASGHTNWPAVMAAIGNYNPSQLALTSITQSDGLVTLTGRAFDDSVVIAYSRALEESGLFSRVVVQSVKLIATPFATPTSTPVAPGTTVTPTATVTPTVTPTPTPDPLDQYEVDDFKPQPIFLGQPQLHNFYPVYDVDRVEFLAKAGRYYRVSTADLAPGVDTFLTVILGGTTYKNDDREPGALSSEIVFQTRAGSDVMVMVKVTNRGRYDPTSWYQLTVEELVPTPTPTPVPTSTPTTSPTPTPTGTPSPTATPRNTPTPTPDLRDEYEPDSPEPALIDARGETQRHNFYPDDDVDTVKFWAKAGYWYRVSTSDLALRVDTVLTVTVDGTSYVNDDREPHEPGDLSSEVAFQVQTGYGTWALVEVANQGREYGPDRWYSITVEEIVPPPTPTPTSTPSSPSSDSRLPGLASLAHGAFLNTASDASAVEFVIVLELKTGGP
jgi:Tfp pilus assembly protein PilN